MSDEPVDPLPKLTEQCLPKCTEPFKKYQECAKRIAISKEGDCEPWYFDHLKCLDDCRVPMLRKHVK
eukprot:CAMPEP_0184987818 /NCGR_PEP_ID=MMETSP1098-20130426/22048_1 /TAXON_ID=89044 /ORGANISM="Spumella elongata, Strain CCAP 955/1" /LENGTH=66 /DNA_ID=CAMNT_0027512419 /DNA_START=44 /DNA_END=244 /DNA_ORIENTATION=+